MKITILYVSVTGNTEKAAGFIKEGMLEAGDVDVRLMNLVGDVPVDTDFVQDSDAVVFGSPAYVATMCWQLKKWLDTDRSIKLAGKLGAAFATENFVYGGGDIAVSEILRHLLVKGMLAYSSGGGCGAPIIHVGPVCVSAELDNNQDLYKIFGKRVAEKALELFGK